MPSFEILLTLFIVIIPFAYIPGPGMLYASAQTLARGRTAGLMAAFGLHIGGYFHVVTAATGLSALFHAVPSVYLLLKLVGVIYLIVLGLRMLVRAFKTHKLEMDTQPGTGQTGWRAFLESVTVEVLNPKTAVFFIAFLPQFIDPAAAFPLWVQLLILGTVVNIIFASADLLCVYFAGMIIDRLRRSSRVANVMEGTGGSILILLGIKLAFQSE